MGSNMRNNHIVALRGVFQNTVRIGSQRELKATP